MGDVKGFLKVKRKEPEYRPVCERVKDFNEVAVLRKDAVSQEQASRCMDCGTSFCQWACPAGNYIPEWNDLLYRGHWEQAYRLLQSTNNLPEITGRVCPALCEYSCVLGINDDPVTIREDELAVIEHAFKHGLVRPHPPLQRTGKKVAVIGSGPAGLACADQLNKAGHVVTLYEKDDAIGGILRYGIPDFKLEKSILDRRIAILEKEGIVFSGKTNVGVDVSIAELEKKFDAVCLTGGSREPRDLVIPGRELSGICFAMEFLTQSNKRVKSGTPETAITAKGKKVVVIGGGDTGADCVGVAHRQGAACVVQIEVMPRPAQCRTDDFPWPRYPLLLKSSTSHIEGGERQWAVLTKRFNGKNGAIESLECVRVEFQRSGAAACPLMKEVAGSEFSIDADLIILAVGFIHPEHPGLLADLGIAFDQRGNVKTDQCYMSSRKGFFAAGDLRRGQSLIVWAISEGRKAAHYIDAYVMGKPSTLPLG
ncbi:MAG: glutamate synthase subunit beta [Candidatus Omnitrophica bacterium]|nr:glutamate synthase subunit beta [Candidatus Omnitrophota bacterium]